MLGGGAIPRMGVVQTRSLICSRRARRIRAQKGKQMRTLLILLSFMSAASISAAQCNPIGWVLVDQRSVSVTERACVYEKSGVRRTIMVDGLCPLNPC